MADLPEANGEQPKSTDMSVNGNVAAQDETASGLHDDPQEEAQQYLITVYLPERPLLPANATSLGVPEPPSPLQIPLSSIDTLNEVRATLTDNHEGYWLGAFCFRRPLKASEAKPNGKTDRLQLSERLSEWVELKTIFGEDAAEDRVIYVTHVQFNEHEARQHLVRFREILSGGSHDPTSLGIDAGISVHDAIRHKEEWIKESQPSSREPVTKQKGGKGQKKDQDKEQASKDVEASAKDAKENPFANWDGWTETPMSALIPEQARKLRPSGPCLRHIAMAQWNPPPQDLRLQGHHYYIHVVTLENDTIYITACTEGFYISNSTSSSFNPTPRPGSASFASVSLYDLLCAYSPLFLFNFAKLFQDPLSQRDFHSIVPITNCMQAFPWLARKHAHTADAARSQIAYLLTGALSLDTLDGTRDWNEELQSTRELPRSTLNERVLRDRFLSRVYAEFVAATARAVPRVAAGEVQAMNPMDKPGAQMFLCNNLFISKGVDGVDLYPHLGGDEAAYVAVGKDLAGIRILNTLDIPGLSLLGTAVVDWKGERWVAQTIVPGLFRKHEDPSEEDEKADEEASATAQDEAKKGEAEKKKKEPTPLEETAVVYGGVDGPEVIRSEPSMHKIFGKISNALRLAEHDIEDAEGEKHRLFTSVECKGLQGADGRKYALDLARLNPLDIEWLEQDIKGKSVNSDTEVGEYPHRLTVLRPELLELYWDSTFRQWARDELDKQEKETKEKEATARDEVKEKDVAAVAEQRKINPEEFKLSFNCDAFVEFKFGGAEDAPSEIKVLVNDESDPTVAAVRSASRHLREIAVPRLVSDAAAGLLQAMDGQALTTHLHLRGINLRYLGLVAHLCEPSQKERLDQSILGKADPGYQVYLDSLRYVCLQEMVVRGGKRVLREMLHECRLDEQANVVSHFLNCLLGATRNPQPRAVHHRSPLQLGSEDPEWTQLTPASLHSKIVEQVARRYRYALPSDFIEHTLQKRQTLRAICLKMGIQLHLRDYDFVGPSEAASPLVNGHAALEGAHAQNIASEESATDEHHNTESKTKKKKRKAAVKLNGALEAAANTTFTPQDVLNLVPVIKDSTPKSALPEEAMEAGRTCLARGERDIGIELIHEGITFAENIYGVVHPEVSRAYAQYASTVHQHASIMAIEAQQRRAKAQAENKEPEEPEISSLVSETLTFANALKLQRLAVTVAERTIGLDSQETLFQWINLSVMERVNRNSYEAMACQKRALELWDIIHGREHPESIQSLMQIAQTLQAINEPSQGMKVFQTAYDLTRKLFGTNSIHTGQAAHAMGESQTLAGDLKSAVSFAKEAYNIFEARLGKEDEQTRDSEQFLSALTAAAVRYAKAEKDALERQRALRARISNTTGPRGALRLTQRQQQAQVRASSASASAADAAPSGPASATVDPELSKRLSQLPVSEIVKYIQGGENSKTASSSSSSRKGKGRAKGSASSRLGR
ncbi:hypothetical protein K437DRAFT_272738 [Tilletiaria anomala UBC 951]|uniref:Clustered mitochondria protein homolog n=1 Tax=Tilletiaria anomala (strain ATCC 24038 / CBS 436.72 / UBC 951) TaxID=1037660 RepID=A0A066WI43_TILAU|nr:uncharacterized protein K437DRAFT_272738 [Tilletiaria anomala UBC 951]KDN52203.1 hypothetical protein K437DRAFT_272738 [Tilletiaria anomala UBC 951]